MRVLIFTKYPQPGMVKTRLGQSVGLERAARLHEAFIRDELHMLTGIGADVTMCCDPSLPLADYERLFGPGIGYRPQQGANLGERMLHALHLTLRKNEAAVLIGSDLPDLPGPHLAEAFAALRTAQVCLGPAPDGGFYLLGLREPLPSDIFRGIAWSGPQALKKTLANCAAAGLTHHLLPAWPDVDTLDDLSAYAARNQNKNTRSMDLIRALGLVEEAWKP